MDIYQHAWQHSGREKCSPKVMPLGEERCVPLPSDPTIEDQI
jgi:hypothetical protein